MSVLAILFQGLRMLAISLFLGSQLLWVSTSTALSSPAAVSSAPTTSPTPPVAVVTSSKTPAPATISQGLAASIPSTNPITTTAPASATPAPAAPVANAPDVNSEARSALVNIFCTTKTGGFLYPISGSGVFIDSRGVILTNAHVAQYFLLRDYPEQGDVNCTVRTGSPAQAVYTATLLYLPPAWIAANAEQIGSSEPTGTGENDYAFLLVTGSADPSVPLPPSFPAISMSTAVPSTGSSVLLASYPAGFIQGITIAMNLYAESAFSTIEQLYSFTGNTPDVVSVGGSIVAQAGSSGGAVVQTSNGALVGLITTDTSAPTTAGRDLHAITLNYINRSLQADGMGGLTSLLTSNVQDVSNVFNTSVAPALTQELIKAL